MGVPSGCQKLVTIMCWMFRSLPSASLILVLVLSIPATSMCIHLSAGSPYASCPDCSPNWWPTPLLHGGALFGWQSVLRI